MAFTIGSGTFTNGSATVTGVTLTSGTLAYFASGTRMVVGVNPVIQEVEAIAAPTVSTITLRSAWTGTGGTYSFLANQTSEGLRDAVQAIRTNNASLQSFIDSIDTAATADSVAQRTSDGSINAVNVYASTRALVGTAVNTTSDFFSSVPQQVVQVDGNIAMRLASPTAGSGVGVAGLSFASGNGSGGQKDISLIRAETSATNGDGGFLQFYTRPNGGSITERLRIDSSGNVGIGVSPTERLEVQTPSGVNCLVKATKSGTDSIQMGVDSAPYINGGALLGFKVGDTERMRIDSSGNVGIGTSSMRGKLTVFKNTFNDPPVQFLVGDNFIGDIRFGRAGTLSEFPASYAMIRGLQGSGDSRRTILTFNTSDTGASTERMRIDSSGNVGIGITNPPRRFTVVNSASASEVARFSNERNVSGDFAITTNLGSNCDNTSSYHYIASTGAADKFYILGNGNVQNTNNSYGALSDAKLKENIEPASPKLDKLMQVDVVNYNLIGSELKQIGVVAQQLEEVFPSMVDESDDYEEVEATTVDEEGNETTEKTQVPTGTKTKSVKYSVFVPILIKAMQEQQEIIKALEARIEALEG